MGMILHLHVDFCQLFLLLGTNIIQIRKNPLLLNTNSLHFAIIPCQLVIVNLLGLEILTTLEMNLVQLIVLLL